MRRINSKARLRWDLLGVPPVEQGWHRQVTATAQSTQKGRNAKQLQQSSNPAQSVPWPGSWLCPVVGFFSIIFLLISLTDCLCLKCFHASFTTLIFFFASLWGNSKSCTTAQAGTPATHASGSVAGHSRTPNTDHSAEGTLS